MQHEGKKGAGAGDGVDDQEKHEGEFLVKLVPFKGYAAFATKKYSRGDLICEERALLSIQCTGPATSEQVTALEEAVSKLSDKDAKRFYALSNCFSIQTNAVAETIDSVDVDLAGMCDTATVVQLHSVPVPQFSSHIFGTFKTNCFDMNGIGSALYPTIARVNHACSPNARQEHDDLTHVERLVATKDIEVGEEISISYIDNRKTTQERRELLSTAYGFHCVCDMCSSYDRNPTLRRFMKSS